MFLFVQIRTKHITICFFLGYLKNITNSKLLVPPQNGDIMEKDTHSLIIWRAQGYKETNERFFKNVKVHCCNYCSYQSDRMYNLNVHQRNKHGNQPYRSPTAMSVGPNGPRAPTIVSVPPQRMGVQYGNGVEAATSHQHASNPHPCTSISK